MFDQSPVIFLLSPLQTHERVWNVVRKFLSRPMVLNISRSVHSVCFIAFVSIVVLKKILGGGGVLFYTPHTPCVQWHLINQVACQDGFTENLKFDITLFYFLHFFIKLSFTNYLIIITINNNQ